MDTDRIAQRFPLVARPRPTCPTLAERIREVSALAEAAHHGGGLSSAATALNRAALIASDCGLPGLAQDLCWRHTELHLNATPLSEQGAKYALEPLINLARLRLRAGDGNGAHKLLTDLTHAVRNKTEVNFNGRTLAFQELTATREDHQAVCQWLWTVLLGDGTRALTTARQWTRAREHVIKHKGVGQRLLDGRQVVIVSHCLNDDPETAQRTLDESALNDPWETPVAALLAMLCLSTAGKPTRDAENRMIAQYLALEGDPELAVFRTRLGLAALNLSHAHRYEVARRLVNDAVHSQDGYVARDVLTHATCGQEMTTWEQQQLNTIVNAAGLDRRSIPPRLESTLMSAFHHGALAVMEQHSTAVRPAD
ncbi:hypothetical protein ACQPZG_20235 [Streptomyces sp. CA-294286]|uniref:hypothetical protein n=1 Tax=Streptomyces sp. CA-294286 TaxID=3240070 RepID=UPI003D8B001E